MDTTSKEYQLAKQMEDVANNLSFDPRKVAEVIPCMHRTLQQSIWRMLRAMIEVYGSDDFRTDLRNKASHEEAKAMLDYLKEHGRYIPMI